MEWSGDDATSPVGRQEFRRSRARKIETTRVRMWRPCSPPAATQRIAVATVPAIQNLKRRSIDISKLASLDFL
jgi:hypothetical protein